MLWYGFNKLIKINKNYYKNKRKNTTVKSWKIRQYLYVRRNLNKFDMYIYVPSQWSILICKFLKKINKDSIHTFYCIFLYAIDFFFFFKIKTNYGIFKCDNDTRVISISNKYVTSFWRHHQNYFKTVFNSLSKFIFKKIKFKGKGYYLFKDSRNTIGLKFGYSHRIYIYINYVVIKFLSKTSIILFGINKRDLFKKSFELYNTRTYNIFTTRGIRFSRQIIYKKIGKVSSYR